MIKLLKKETTHLRRFEGMKAPEMRDGLSLHPHSEVCVLLTEWLVAALQFLTRTANSIA